MVEEKDLRYCLKIFISVFWEKLIRDNEKCKEVV